MAKKTHRWIPKMKIRFNGPHKRINSNAFMSNIFQRAKEMLHDPCCLITPKFENSLYYGDSNVIKNNEVTDIFIHKRSNCSLDSVDTPSLQIKTTRMFKNEYLLSNKILKFHKKYDSTIRCYIFMEISDTSDQVVNLLGEFKHFIGIKIWNSFKIVLFDNSSEIKNILIFDKKDQINSVNKTSYIANHLAINSVGRITKHDVLTNEDRNFGNELNSAQKNSQLKSVLNLIENLFQILKNILNGEVIFIRDYAKDTTKSLNAFSAFLECEESSSKLSKMNLLENK